MWHDDAIATLQSLRQDLVNDKATIISIAKVLGDVAFQKYQKQRLSGMTKESTCLEYAKLVVKNIGHALDE